jgi:hypothetical protein
MVATTTTVVNVKDENIIANPVQGHNFLSPRCDAALTMRCLNAILVLVEERGRRPFADAAAIYIRLAQCSCITSSERIIKRRLLVNINPLFLRTTVIKRQKTTAADVVVVGRGDR